MEFKAETWRNVRGYEGYYEVSSDGRVRSLCRLSRTKGGCFRFVSGKILSPYKDRYGYLMVSLFVHGKRKIHLVHRLVGLSFLKNMDNKPQINHIDGDKSNNCVSNLEWSTAKENIQHALKCGLSNNNSGPKKLTKEKVDTIRSMYKSGKYYQKDLAKIFNVVPSNINQIVNRKTWKDI